MIIETYSNDETPLETDCVCVDDNIDIRFIRKGDTNDYEIRILKSNIGEFDIKLVDTLDEFRK